MLGARQIGTPMVPPVHVHVHVDPTTPGSVSTFVVQ